MQTASLGRIFQGYGFAELNRDLHTTTGFNAGILGVDTLRSSVKQETLSEMSRHGIRFVDYSKTVTDLDPLHLIRSDYTGTNIYATNVYEEQHLKYGLGQGAPCNHHLSFSTDNISNYSHFSQTI